MLVVESLAVGDELLDGRIADSNTARLGAALSLLGLSLSRTTVVDDDVERIAAALREAAGRAPSAVLTVALYTVAVAVGLALLVVPGVYLAVRLYFGAQAAVVEQLGPVGALRASAQLVRNQWARCFLYLFGSTILLGIPPALLGELAAQAIEDGTGAAGFLTVSLVVEAVFMSLTALFGTLLYFDLRRRRATGGF